MPHSTTNHWLLAVTRQAASSTSSGTWIVPDIQETWLRDSSLHQSVHLPTAITIAQSLKACLFIFSKHESHGKTSFRAGAALVSRNSKTGNSKWPQIRNASRDSLWISMYHFRELSPWLDKALNDLKVQAFVFAGSNKESNFFCLFCEPKPCLQQWCLLVWVALVRHSAQGTRAVAPSAVLKPKQQDLMSNPF